MRSELAEYVSDARRVSVAEFCLRRHIRLLGANRGQPCPGCGGRDRFSVGRNGLWFCRRGEVGGDAIALAQHVDGGDFWSACEAVLGRPRPAGAPPETAEDRKRREAERARNIAAAQAEAERKERSENAFRRAERERAWRIWRNALPSQGTAVEAYLALRGLRLPDRAALRYAPQAKLWDAPLPDGRVVHEGPAMVAAIVGADGRFIGAHQTFVDLSADKGKVLIADAKTGELVAAKKTRGSWKGGSIPLVRALRPSALFLGEGIETVLSVHDALADAGAPLARAASFRSGVSLGNLSGKAKARARHPEATYVDKRGAVRPVMVAGPEPLDEEPWPVVAIPPSVRDVYLIEDGDSEPFFTRCAMQRAAARIARARPDLSVRLVSVAGVDMNDLRMGRRPGEREAAA